MSTQVDRKVEFIGALRVHTRQTIEKAAHMCTFDEQGRCLYCSARSSESTLRPQGRTGELS